MKPLLAAALLLVVAGCAGRQPMLTPDQQAQCAAEGGCILTSRARIEALLDRAAELGAAAAFEAAQQQGCRRGDKLL